MAPEPTVAVLEDRPVEGLADRVARLDGELDPEATARLERGMIEDGVPVGAERGFRETLGRAVERLRGAGPGEDLGEAGAAFEMLALHVPPGGRAGVDLRQSGSTERRISFGAFGFGFGAGRTVTVELGEGIAERGTCMRIVQHLTVHVWRVPTDDGDLLRTDVVGSGAQEFIAWPDCPHCLAPGEPDPFEFDTVTDRHRALDLRGYDAEVTRSSTVTLEGERNAEVGVRVPLPAAGTLSAGVHVHQSTLISCTLTYAFPPGRRFTPFRRPGDGGALPFWRAT